MSVTDEPLSLEGLTFATLDLSLKNHILTVTLNRPDRKNAINPTMSNELVYIFDYAKYAKDVRVIVLAANGDVFCAGGDLRVMSGGNGGAVSNVPKRGDTDEISLKIRNVNKPVIAKIQGPVLAGALLLVCNATHAYAADHAYFSAPEIKRGIWPFMVMAGLFRLMGKRAGLDFIMRGNSLSAAEAVQHGLINETVPLAELDLFVGTLARDMAKLAPMTMQLGLAAYHAQEDMAFDDALPFLKSQLAACLKSDDAKEGIAAFIEKREPEWP